MNLEKLKTEYAEIYQQIKSEGRTEIMESVEVLFGPEARADLEKIQNTGMTARQLLAAKEIFGSGNAVETPSSSMMDQILEGLKSAPRAVAGSPDGQEFEKLVDEHQQQHGCKRLEALQAVAEGNPDLHDAWVQAQQKGGYHG